MTTADISDDERQAMEAARDQAPSLRVDRPGVKVVNVQRAMPYYFVVDFDDQIQRDYVVLDGEIVTTNTDANLRKYLQLVGFLEHQSLSREDLLGIADTIGEVPEPARGWYQTPGPGGEPPEYCFDEDGALAVVYGRSAGAAGESPWKRVTLRVHRDLRFEWHVDLWDSLERHWTAVPLASE